MENTVPIAIKDALRALWYINEVWGFKYPFAEFAILFESMRRGKYYCTPSIPQERISMLLENILKLSRLDYPFVHLVLWLNANINRPNQDLMSSVDQFQGKRILFGHEKDLFKLREFIGTVPEGEKVTLTVGSVGQKSSVTLDNEQNWFLSVCDSWLPSYFSAKDAELFLLEMKDRTGSKDNDERLCAAYGVFRFLREIDASNGERTSALLHFIWQYLVEMGLEERQYDPNLTGSLNVNIGRYDKRYLANRQKSNFHFSKIPILSIPEEELSKLLIK